MFKLSLPTYRHFSKIKLGDPHGSPIFPNKIIDSEWEIYKDPDER